MGPTPELRRWVRITNAKPRPADPTRNALHRRTFRGRSLYPHTLRSAHRTLSIADRAIRCADDILPADHSDKPFDGSVAAQAARLRDRVHRQVAPGPELGGR